MTLLDEWIRSQRLPGTTSVYGGTIQPGLNQQFSAQPLPVDPRTGGSVYGSQPGGSLGSFIPEAPYMPPLGGGSPTYGTQPLSGGSGTYQASSTLGTQPLNFGPRPGGTVYNTQPINTGGSTYTPQPVAGPPPPLTGIQQTTHPSYRSGTNPYLDPRSNYGGTPGGYNDPLSKTAGRLNPQSEFTRALALAGLGGTSRRDQFAQGQFNKFNQGYNAATLNNPFLSLRDYMGGLNLGDSLRQQYAAQTQSQRGLNNPSRTSIVRWG